MISTLYYTLSIIVVSFPIYLTFIIGPKVNTRRLTYMALGFVFASTVGLIVVTIDIQRYFTNPESLIAKISHGILGGLLEEIFRYPSIILSQMLGIKFFSNKEKILDKNVVKMQWTNIDDPHGMGLYFGVGWGMFETVIYYIYQNIQSIINNEQWILVDHIQPISVRATSVMAHIALTYLAMIITVNRGFYRFSIILHTGVNTINLIFSSISPNYASRILFLLFSRFAMLVIVYFMLKPRVRYISPAVLLLVEVVLFLFFIILGSLVYLFSLLIGISAI